MQFVRRSAAAKSKLLAQERIIEQFHKGAADDQVLFDLSLLAPGNGAAPGDDVLRRDHSSISGR
jgi:hypothetical protein